MASISKALKLFLKGGESHQRAKGPNEAVQNAKRVLEESRMEEYRQTMKRRAAGNRHFALPGDAPLTDEQCQEVREYWKKYSFLHEVDPQEMATYVNRSGIFDARYFPFELKRQYLIPWVTSNRRYSCLESKAYIHKYLPHTNMPFTPVTRNCGTYFDSDYNVINEEQALKLLLDCEDELVIKPTMMTSGGQGIAFLKDPDMDTLVETLKPMGDNFVVQTALKQHELLASMNQSTVNTIRITSYRRSPSEVVLLAAVLKIGGSSTRVDNYKQGGCLVGVDYETGKLNNWGLGCDYRRITTLPSGVVLDDGDIFIPNWDDVRREVEVTHQSLPMIPLLSYDMAIDENGRPCVIEINLNGDWRLHQITTGPVFREYTDEILRKAVAATGFFEKSNMDFDFAEYPRHIEIVKYCGDQETLAIPARINKKPVTKIRSGAFERNGTLAQVDLPSTIRYIGPKAFSRCKNLKAVNCDHSVGFIAKSAFEHIPAFEGKTPREILP